MLTLDEEATLPKLSPRELTVHFAFGSVIMVAAVAVLSLAGTYLAPWLAGLIGLVLHNSAFSGLITWIFRNMFLILPMTLYLLHKRFIIPPKLLLIDKNLLIGLTGTLKNIEPVLAKAKNYDDMKERIWGLRPYQVVARINLSLVKRISIDEKASKNKSAVLVFDTGITKTPVRIGDFMTQTVRAELRDAIKQYAPQAKVEPSVYGLLEPQPDVSYTELWISALSAPPERLQVTALQAGAKIREYTVSSQLPSGGQANLYKAKTAPDTAGGGDKDVVIKEFILPIHVSRAESKEMLQNFEEEARLLQGLIHAQIVKLLDFFSEDHKTYMVFEYVDGKNLRSLVQAKQLFDENTVIRLAQQMCTILDHLHSCSPPVIHRDFTPDNLMLEADGKLKLIDFNVAQKQDEQRQNTVAGKRAFTPPEQLRGKATTQSDIYALGATLFYLLTAEEPEPLSVLHVKDFYPPVSKNLDAVIAKCTELELSKRYENVNQVKADLLNAQ